MSTCFLLTYDVSWSFSSLFYNISLVSVHSKRQFDHTLIYIIHAYHMIYPSISTNPCIIHLKHTDKQTFHSLREKKTQTTNAYGNKQRHRLTRDQRRSSLLTRAKTDPPKPASNTQDTYQVQGQRTGNAGEGTHQWQSVAERPSTDTRRASGRCARDLHENDFKY